MLSSWSLKPDGTANTGVQRASDGTRAHTRAPGSWGTQALTGASGPHPFETQKRLCPTGAGVLNHTKTYRRGKIRAPGRPPMTKGKARGARLQPQTCPRTAARGRQPWRLREPHASERPAPQVQTAPGRHSRSREPEPQSQGGTLGALPGPAAQSGRLRHAGRGGPAGRAEGGGGQGSDSELVPGREEGGQSGKESPRDQVGSRGALASLQRPQPPLPGEANWPQDAQASLTEK